MIRFSDIFDILFPQFQNTIWSDVIQVLISISPIILALILFLIFWPLWKNYTRSAWLFSLKFTVLEIKLPKDILKSPLAMELVLNALHNTADGGNFAQYWRGEKRPMYSLEIASVEGVVKFFIWTEDRRKNGVMSALYSQFPGIEVHEVEDYTKGVHFDPKESKLWGGEFVFMQIKEARDILPIKTYVDYGLDRDPKEELKVDPMTPMLEFLGNVGMDQQIWFQFMIRAHIAEQIKPGHFFTKTNALKDNAKKYIDKMMDRAKKDDEEEDEGPPALTKAEKDLITAIERKVGKLTFDVGIRTIYMAKKELFDKPNGIGGIISAFKHFNTENYNGLKPDGWSSNFKNLPWEDYKNMRQNRVAKLVLEAYKRRSFFYDPFASLSSEPLVMSTEELATMYHFPGQVAITPSISRVPSKKGQPPFNLPI